VSILVEMWSPTPSLSSSSSSPWRLQAQDPASCMDDGAVAVREYERSNCGLMLSALMSTIFSKFSLTNFFEQSNCPRNLLVKEQDMTKDG
jgi:hypothetical protein